MDWDKPESNSEWVPDLTITTAHSPLQRPVSRSVTPLVIVTAIYDPGLSIYLSSSYSGPLSIIIGSVTLTASATPAIMQSLWIRHRINVMLPCMQTHLGNPGIQRRLIFPGQGLLTLTFPGQGYFTGQLKATYPKLSGSLVTHAHLPGSGVTNPHLPAQGLLTPSFLLKGYLLTFPGQGLLTLTFPRQGFPILPPQQKSHHYIPIWSFYEAPFQHL